MKTLSAIKNNSRGFDLRSLWGKTKQDHSLPYNPALDGIRGIAALIVVFFHFRAPGFHNGYVAVDIFFVLSGYLITQVLVKDFREHHSLGGFYWRRFLRLMPAIILLLLVFSPFLVGTISAVTIFENVLAAFFYVSNWIRAFPVGLDNYFGNCWSLAIEEQFYLLWPPIFLFLTRRYSKNRLLIPTLALYLAVIAWHTWLDSQQATFDRTLNGFDTHCDNLLLGCIMVLGLDVRAAKAVYKFLATLWPVAIAVLVYLITFADTWNAAISAATGVSSAILILAAMQRPHSLIRRVLELFPLVSIGRISYALYLWNSPIQILLSRKGFSDLSTALIGIPLSFLCAILSYGLVERPALRLRHLRRLRMDRLGWNVVMCSITGMLIASTYFYNDSLMQMVFPTPLMVQEYGPHSLKAGDGYNVQPNGESWMWMHFSHYVAQNVRVHIGDITVTSYANGHNVNAMLPPEVRNKAGTYSVSVVDFANKAIAEPVTIEVKP